MATVNHPGTWRLAATCSRGLEDVVATELVGLGAGAVDRGRGVVTFTGDLATVVRANLWLRSAIRVLVQLNEGPAASRDELYALAADVPWEDLLARGQTFAVTAAGKGEGFRSEAFAALTVKDGIVDRLRRTWGVRPDVDREHPDVPVHLHLGGRWARLALDSTGEPLSHRGWRPRGGPAPLAEALAAGVLMLAGYHGSVPLVDPMCGTGTLAVEGALIATRSAPGLRREFACQRWHFAEPRGLARERESARGAIRPAPMPILACDQDERAVRAARRNAAAAGVAGEIHFARRDIRELAVPASGSVVVVNPPYGHRLGEESALRELYRALGDALKQRATGCTAWVLTGSPSLAASIGLQASRRIVLFNGPIECRLLRFEVYSGSRRSGSTEQREP